ncbi:MAG TPA: hypothetical protein ENN39_12430 [Desulfonatronum sp.]|nr:hypothetical protein [Desulfonatronum sp.]
MPFGVHRRDAPPWEGLLRSLGVIFVFMGVIWLFWRHYDRTLEMMDAHRIGPKHVLLDKTNTLTDKQKKAVRDLSRALKSSFGLELQVIVDVEPLDPPQQDMATIFIGVYPDGRQAVVILPPLVERAVGRELASHLSKEHFSPYWQSGDWPGGLGKALGLIWNGLNEPAGQNVPLNGGQYRGKIGEQSQ